MAMAAMAEAAAAAMEAENGGGGAVDTRIDGAVAARRKYIRDNANSLTMGKFRRLLEKDLGVEQHALDPHKKRINQLVDQIMNAEDDPAPGVSDVAIKEALAKKSSYLKTESRNIELDEVTRLLEEDLSLEKFALDSKRELIKSLLDEILNTSDVTKEDELPSTSEAEALGENEEIKKRKQQSPDKSRKKKRISKRIEESDSEESKKQPSRKKGSIASKLDESDEENSADRKPKPNKAKKSEPEPESDEDSKESKESKEYKSDSDDGSAKKIPKKKAAKSSESKPVVSKAVEQLKQMIKSAGMSIPPSMYKRVKQAPEAKRENALIKELEGILEKEGLSRNSSEKEVKAVRRKKDKQKDLEGIDVGNIITEGRGRRQQANMFYDTPSIVKKKTIISDDEEESEEV